jgi:threonine synthase
MQFISTRDPKNCVNFEKAVLDCMPGDGGLYVPADALDLRRWILYTDEETSFANIAGTLTSACINDEFSPIICETIAARAFPFEPKVTQLDDRHFTLELCHGPTGSHKDFGISYLVNCLETILQMEDRQAVFLDVTFGELGASIARALRGKKHLKAVLVYPKGLVRGLSESDYVWNGGSVFPIEVNGTEADCHALVRSIFADRSLVEKYHLTVANTANIGRLMPQVFFYPYAFSRLKKIVHSDIYYTLAPGNYSNIVAGLYSWRLSLPVNGFICPATDALTTDLQGAGTVLDSVVPLVDRMAADPASPSNLERLEEVFHTNSLILKSLVFPAKVTDAEADDACRQLFMKYHLFADRHTSRAYAAAIKRADQTEADESAIVLVVRDHPARSAQYIKHTVGEAPEIPAYISDALRPVSLGRPLITDAEEIIFALDAVV